VIIVFVLYEEGPVTGLLRFHRYRCPIYLNHTAFNQVGAIWGKWHWWCRV